jgi:hypothetical protein
MRAETVAAAVPLSDALGFRAARTRVREALRADGVAAEIETATATLLDHVAPTSSPGGT